MFKGCAIASTNPYFLGKCIGNLLYSVSAMQKKGCLGSLSYDSIMKQIMCIMLQDRPFNCQNINFRSSLEWNEDAVREVLRAVPRIFFQSSRSFGCQRTFRRRAPLKQRNLRQEDEDFKKGIRLHGPAAYRDLAKVELGVRKALEFYSWVEGQCGFIHNETTCREMACVLAKGNKLKKLWDFLHGMVQRNNHFVNTRTLTCIIKILGEEGLVNEALAAFYRMKQFHCKQDVVSYNTIIGALCRVGYFRKAKSLLEQMELPGYRCPPDKFTYTIMISSYCKYSLQTGCRKAIRRRMWEANHLFRHMLFRGFSPDVVTYNCLIDGLCKTCRVERALELFDDMIKRGCTPNKVTYNSFIRYFSVVNEMNKAIEMMRNMKLNNHGMPSSSSFTPIIHALCESKRPLEALQFLVEMVNGGHIPREYTYKLVCDSLAIFSCSNALSYELRRKIEDGIHTRAQQVMRLKPTMTFNSLIGASSP